MFVQLFKLGFLNAFVFENKLSIHNLFILKIFSFNKTNTIVRDFCEYNH